MPAVTSLSVRSFRDAPAFIERSAVASFQTSHACTRPCDHVKLTGIDTRRPRHASDIAGAAAGSPSPGPIHSTTLLQPLAMTSCLGEHATCSVGPTWPSTRPTGRPDSSDHATSPPSSVPSKTLRESGVKHEPNATCASCEPVAPAPPGSADVTAPAGGEREGRRPRRRPPGARAHARKQGRARVVSRRARARLRTRRRRAPRRRRAARAGCCRRG